MYLWSISWTERVLSSSFLFGQAIDVGLEYWWSRKRSWLCHNQSSVHLFSGQPSYQNTDIITGLSVVECFIKCLYTDDLRFELASVSVEFDLIADFDLTLFDSTGSDGTSTSDVVSTFNRHEEGFVDSSLRDGDFLIHGVEKLFNLLLSQFRVNILNRRNRRSSDKYSFLGIILMLL